MANEDGMNAGTANANTNTNTNTNTENGKGGGDGEPHVIGWFYAFDADNDPGDAGRLIWVSLEDAADGGREVSLHAGDLIKQHAENRPLLLDDVKLLGRALAGYADEKAKDVTFRRYTFSCVDEPPQGILPIARFTAEVGTGEEGMTVTHRCAVNSQLKDEVLVGAQRLVAGMIGNLPRLFGQLEESERNDGMSTEAIADIASDLFDMAGGKGSGNSDVSAGSDAPAGSGARGDD